MDSGTVKLKLYKGNCINAGVKSPNSLYMEEIATFGDSHDLYSQCRTCWTPQLSHLHK